MKKRKKSKDLLARQRPQKRHKFNLNFLVTKKYLYILTACLIIISLAIFIANYDFNHFFRPNNLSEWSIIIQETKRTPIPAKERSRIVNIIKKHLLTSNQQSTFQETADKILAKSHYGFVQLLQLDSKKLLVKLRVREPVFSIAADKERLVSSSGLVYGLAKLDHQLPKLTGVLTKAKKNNFLKSNNSLKLSQDEATIINEAIELQKKLNENNLNFSELEYKQYRGFFTTIRNLNLQVSFGRSPFQLKVRKLFRVINKLKQNNTVASRIELDYDGKAFIREKKHHENYF